VLAQAFSKEPQHKVTVLLQRNVLAPIATIGILVAEVLRTLELDRDPAIGPPQVYVPLPLAVKGNRQLGVEVEQPCGVGERFACFATRTYTNGRLQ
jgi:hypothetical protein